MVKKFKVSQSLIINTIARTNASFEVIARPSFDSEILSFSDKFLTIA